MSVWKIYSSTEQSNEAIFLTDLLCDLLLCSLMKTGQILPVASAKGAMIRDVLDSPFQPWPVVLVCVE